MNKSTVVMVAALVTLGGLMLFLFTQRDSAFLRPISFNTNSQKEAVTEAETTDNTAEGNTEAVRTGERTADVASAPSAPLNTVALGEVEGGSMITVPSATLVRSGYVVLYNINSNGESRVIGHSDLLSPSTHFNIKIQLTGPIAEKQAVVAVLHQDDGDGKFEYPESDGYLKNGAFLVNDIDVVGIKRDDQESKVLESQVATLVENNF